LGGFDEGRFEGSGQGDGCWRSPMSQKVQAIIAKANYEPPKITSFPTGGMTEIMPVTMSSNL
jgi:hypothetical protein